MSSPDLSAIASYIRGISTDYEEGIAFPGLSWLKKWGLLIRKIEGSSNIYSNTVTGEPPEEKLEAAIEDVMDFFKGMPFSWNARYDQGYQYVMDALEKHGMKPREYYAGMYRLADHPAEKPIVPSIVEVRDAESHSEMEILVDLTCRIFGISSVSNRDTMLKERLSYLRLPSRRGGFCLAYYNGSPAGYSGYRISNDGKAMYLTGAGVLEEFRGKGLYSALLNHREYIAVKSGCGIMVVSAKEDTSKPLLLRKGFNLAGSYVLMARDAL